MPNIMNQELVRAFNIILCHNEVAITNLIVQSTDQTFLKKEDRIVISFDKNMDVGQCMKYLHNIKKSIVETFCGSESGANMSFNTQFFPFNLNERQLTKDKEGYKFSVPIDKGVVFNLKCLLAHGLAKDAKEDMGNEFGERCMEGRVYDVRFDRKSYLYCMRFYDKKLQDYFVESFSSRIKNYKNGPKSTNDFLKIKDNCVYIKGSIFNKAKFIKDIVKHKASLECRDFEVTSAEDETVESLKFPVIDLSRTVGIPINSVLHVSYTGSGENSVLIPAAKEIIDNIIYYKILSKEQADDINKVFGMTVLNNVEDCISPKHLPVFGRRGIYGIDFANQDISYCVLNKIMESSVINKDHELAIDPELPRTLLAEASQTRGCPKRSRGKGLERPPRQGSEREGGKGGLFQLVPGKIDSSQSTGDQSQLSSGEIDLSQSTGDQSQLSLGAGEGTLTEANIQDQKRSSSIPSLRAWDSSTFLNSEDSLKDTENICNEEPEKQQVTDESDRKSSDECSKAKPQDSKSPEKKHGDGLLCSNSSIGSMWSKLKGNVLPSLKRNNKGRGSVYSISSSVSAPGGSVPEKLPVSESSSSFPGRIKAKSNPPSAVTSPTHEGVPEWQQRLNPDQREELRPFLSPEERKKLNSNYFSPGEEWHLYLTRTLSGKRELSRFLCESEESQLRRLAEAQLSSPDNSSSKKVDRDSGFCSMGSPAVQHKGSVPSEVKECEVEPVSEALRK